MGISVFIISTPSQAFFLDKAGIIQQGSILITTTKEKINEVAILNYLGKYNWSNINHWQIPRSSKKSEYYKILLIQLTCLKFVILNKSRIDSIFIGSYANIYHKNLVSYFPEKTQLNLVYDGLQVLAVIDNRRNNLEKFKNLPLLHRLLFYRNSKIQRLNYVVPFYFKPPKTDSIDVFQISTCKQSKYDEKRIFFIGQPLEEIKAISQDYYLTTLRKFIALYETKKVYYVPHPREKQSKVDKISDICEIYRPGKVFEEFYLEATEKPLYVVSFYSSVLLNLFAIDQKVNLISLQIPFEELKNPRFKKIIEPVYRFFNEISCKRFRLINLN